MIRRGLLAGVALAFALALASAAVAAPTALSPPSITWGGPVGSVVPVQVVGYDSLSAAPCIVGSSASCLLPAYNGATLAYQLLSNGSATSAQQLVTVGRSYVYACTGTWNGGSAQLQILGPDGTTWLNLGSALSSNGSASVSVGAQTYVRVFISGGPPSGLYCTLS